MAVFEDVPLVKFMYPVFTHMPDESYHRRLRSLLLCLCDIFQVLIIPLFAGSVASVCKLSARHGYLIKFKKKETFPHNQYDQLLKK